jgi:DNA-binding NtrC family response regulator
LVTEIQAGRFREDFYYRLCSDVISTPPLHEQLAEAPEDLPRLVGFVARGLVGAEQAEGLSEEVVEVVTRQLGRGYPWPGNFRELEQCVRNVLVRRCYRPIRLRPNDPVAALSTEIAAGRLTAEELLRRYCSIVYAQTQNIEETARRLNVDRRTVKARLTRVAEPYSQR